MEKKYYIFFGAPGSGKGTQAEILGKRLRLPAISTGAILRKEIKDKTDLGRAVEAIIAAGNLVPDEIVGEMIAGRLVREDAEAGAIFDGYPRTIIQQDFILRIFKEQGVNEEKIYPLLVDVSDEEVERRLGGRRACSCGATYHMVYNPPKSDETCDVCGAKIFIRPDDKPEVIRERLNVYHKNVDPVIEYWNDRDKLIKINGEQSINAVAEEIKKKLL